MKKVLVSIFLILASLFIIHNSVSAQDEQASLGQDFAGQEHIQNFQSNIAVNKDGTTDVVETILYDFGYRYRHGIYRYLPYSKMNDQNKRVILDFSKFSVKDENGKKYQVDYITSNFNHELKIGDPNRTITGVHTYVISYHVAGALGYFKDHDELYWNITGTGWDVPIASVSATINLPQTFRPSRSKLSCYTGPSGSTTTNCSYNTNGETGNVVKFETTQALNSSEGLTTVVGFPKGTTAILLPKIYVPFWQRWYGRLLLIALFILATIWYIVYPIWIILKWLNEGRDPQAVTGVVSAWYDPPKTANGRPLTPAECGALVDERVDNEDISAAIVDLARRGYFKIEERDKKDFYFVRKSPPQKDSLLPFEQILYDGIFGGEDEVRIKDQDLYVTITSVKDTIYKSLVTEGFFPKNPNTIRNSYIIVGSIALSTFNLPVAICAFLFGRNIPAKTQAGADAAAVARSLKNFLRSQDKQLEFQAKYQYWFEKLLPFAVAFGVEKIWAKRFENITLKQPDWYSGYGTTQFNSIYFASSLHSSFNSVASVSTPPSSSSSGFSSGGGFSGGGGGGGGGGSW